MDGFTHILYLPTKHLMSVVDLSRSMVAQRLVQSITVVKLKILTEPVLGLTYLLVIVQINLLVFHAAPKTFKEYVIDPTASAVHADLYVLFLETLVKIIACKL